MNTANMYHVCDEVLYISSWLDQLWRAVCQNFQFHLKVPLTQPHIFCMRPDLPLILTHRECVQESVIRILGNINLCQNL